MSNKHVPSMNLIDVFCPPLFISMKFTPNPFVVNISKAGREKTEVVTKIFPKDSLFASSLLLRWNLFVTYWESRDSLM